MLCTSGENFEKDVEKRGNYATKGGAGGLGTLFIYFILLVSANVNDSLVFQTPFHGLCGSFLWPLKLKIMEKPEIGCYRIFLAIDSLGGLGT